MKNPILGLTFIGNWTNTDLAWAFTNGIFRNSLWTIAYITLVLKGAKQFFASVLTNDNLIPFE